MNDIKTRSEAVAAGCLEPGHYIDSDSEPVRAFVQRALAGAADGSEAGRAVRLFYAVRDDIRYDPYAFSLEPKDYVASAISRHEAAFCVPKAILLTACLRAAGIAAAVGFADVRNHLNSPKLAELMQSDLFIYHGYVQLWLGDKSFKVTPAFNVELCERFGVRPLDFDGTADALFHEFDAGNRRHMEYVNDRGVFQDAPMDEILAAYAEFYPRLADHAARLKSSTMGGSDAAFTPSA